MKSQHNPDGQKRLAGVATAARNSAVLVTTQFTSILIRLVYLFVLARSVPPESYGILTYALSWYLVFLPFTYLGADVVLSRGIARQRTDAPALLGATLGARLVAAPVMLSIALLLAATIEPAADIRHLVILFSLALFGRSLWMWSAAAFTAFEETRSIAGFEVAVRSLEVVLLLLLLELVGPDLHWIAAIHASSWLLQGLAATFAVMRRHAVKLNRPDHNWNTVIHEGVPGAIFSIAMPGFFQLPIILFRQVQGTGDALGYFALAFQIVSYLLTIPYVVANASLPVLSRSSHRMDGKDRIAVLALSASIVIGGAAVVMVAALTAGPIIEQLFGRNYSPTASVLVGGLWLLIPASLAMLFQQVLFSNAIRTWLGTAGPLIGIAAMSIVFLPLSGVNEYLGPLLAVGSGLVAWLACAFIESARAGFFRLRVQSAS